MTVKGTITEKLSRDFYIECDSLKQAEDKLKKLYANHDIALSRDEDRYFVKFDVNEATDFGIAINNALYRPIYKCD